ncbi:MAG TPA: hypothetical protein VHE34_09135 [Puia sp.]|uniref:hypothetical protein n=1 Tax=Puia sp. TaxID=2045100 RepID=UPI002C906CDD|nr:hypothetical protein [Puia sp.]HVU95376.1 hypothetical protein [Puia sp.]
MESQLEWEIKIVRDRYRWLKLTPGQARAVWKMEQEDHVMGRPDGELFTYWEKMDRDFDRWQSLLKPEQFKLWVSEHKMLLREHEKQLIRDDAKQLKEIEYHQTYINWLRKTFLPQLHKEMGLEGFGARNLQEERFAYLRAEFRVYRARQKRNLVLNHYRFSRRLQPNGLRLALLRHELWTLMPDYHSFFHQADDGIKAVANLFLDYQRTWFAQKGERLLSELGRAGEQRKLLREKFFGDETRKGGWHFVMERKTDLTPAEEAWMSYLLMDTLPQTIEDLIRYREDK